MTPLFKVKMDDGLVAVKVFLCSQVFSYDWIIAEHLKTRFNLLHFDSADVSQSHFICSGDISDPKKLSSDCDLYFAKFTSDSGNTRLYLLSADPHLLEVREKCTKKIIDTYISHVQ